MTSVVYFRRDNRVEGGVYVGHTDRPGSRNASHLREGREWLAGVNAAQRDEKLLHVSLSAYRVPLRGVKSVYAGDAVWDYIAWLVSHGYATTDPTAVQHLPLVPFEAWSPHNVSPYGQRNGQMSLAAAVPAPERVRFESSYGYLVSEGDEWFSPPLIVDPGRRALGGVIDCDPASCAAANQIIRATTFYSRQVSGLEPQHPWRGATWMNPPYGKGEESAGPFVARLCEEYIAGNVTAAIAVLNVASFTTKWFRPLQDLAAGFAFIHGRPNFIPPDPEIQQSSPNKGIVLVYLGSRFELFAHEFEALGKVLRNG